MYDCMYDCMYVCLYVCMPPCVYVCMHMHACMRVCLCVRACVRACVHACVRMCLCVCMWGGRYSAFKLQLREKSMCCKEGLTNEIWMKENTTRKKRHRQVKQKYIKRSESVKIIFVSLEAIMYFTSCRYHRPTFSDVFNYLYKSEKISETNAERRINRRGRRDERIIRSKEIEERWRGGSRRLWQRRRRRRGKKTVEQKKE